MKFPSENSAELTVKKYKISKLKFFFFFNCEKFFRENDENSLNNIYNFNSNRNLVECDIYAVLTLIKFCPEVLYKIKCEIKVNYQLQLFITFVKQALCLEPLIKIG